MSRPARNRTGSNKARPAAAKRPGAQQGGKPAGGKSTGGKSTGGKPAGGKEAPGPSAKPAAKPSAAPPKAKPTANAEAAPARTPAAGTPAAGTPPAGTPPGRSPRASRREAFAIPGNRTFATTASVPLLAGSLAGLFLLGFAVGLGGALMHYMRVGGVPTGTLLGVLAAAGVAFAAGVLLRSRVGAAIPSAGWLVAGILLASPRAEGDLLIGGKAMDFGFLIGGVFTLLAVCALPYARLAAEPAPADYRDPPS